MIFFKKKKKDAIIPETEEFVLRFPLYACLYKRGFEEIPDYEPIKLSGKEAYDRILQDINGNSYISECCEAFGIAKLHQYYPKSGIIFDTELRITEEGVSLITAKVKKGLSESEKNEIYDFFNGQMSDGWGEDSIPEFEADEDDPDIECFQISFWNYSSDQNCVDEAWDDRGT